MTGKPTTEFSLTQLKAIEYLSEDVPLRDIQKECDISSTTLWRWRRDSLFSAAVISSARAKLNNELPSVYKNLAKIAKGRGASAVQAIKALLEHQERIEEKNGQYLQGGISFTWKAKWDEEDSTTTESTD